MPHPAQLLSDPRRPYVPQGTTTDPAPASPSSPTAHSPLPTALLPFDPPAHLIPKIIRELADPTLSLAMTARNFSTDLDALCVWMTREDIAQRIFTTESAFAVKTRLAASNNMPMVAQTCQAIIHEFHDDQHHMNFKPQDPNGHEVKRRNRETSMRAGRLLLRLSKYVPMSPAAVSRAAQGGPPLRGGSSTASPNSSNANSTPRPRKSKPSPELLALLNNPKLATQLANAVAAQLSQRAASAVNSDTNSAPNSTNPPNRVESPTAADAHACSSEISNLKSEILPTLPTSAPASQSEIPNPQSEIAPAPPAPTSAIPHPKSNIPPDPRHPRSSAAPSPPTPVPLTNSAHPVFARAGSPHARAP